jgi:hypothetical protein
VKPVAGGGLARNVEKGPRVVEQHATNGGALIESRFAVGGIHSQCSKRSLHNHMLTRGLSAQEGRQADHAFRANHPCFYAVPIGHPCDDRGHPIVDEIDVVERPADLINNLS